MCSFPRPSNNQVWSVKKLNQSNSISATMETHDSRVGFKSNRTSLCVRTKLQLPTQRQNALLSPIDRLLHCPSNLTVFSPRAQNFFIPSITSRESPFSPSKDGSAEGVGGGAGSTPKQAFRPFTSSLHGLILRALATIVNINNFPGLTLLELSPFGCIPS